MTVLSERELIGELGKGILLHPLKPGSIKACNICLTASEYAYAIGRDERLPIMMQVNPNNPNEEQKYFELPPRDTTLVWTDESLWLSSYLCSTIHSRVELVSKGMGHIGTRVNPWWLGVLCIAFHNLSDTPRRLYVRNTKEPIAYLMVHRLSSKSSIKSNIDTAARLDVLQGCQNAREIYEWYNNRANTWMSTDKNLLKKLMIDSDEYKNLKSGGVQLFVSSYIGSDQMTVWTAIIAITGLGASLINLATILFGK